MPPSVSVLILNYNGREHLQTCLPTVEAQVYPKNRLSIEVVDNGSTDGSVAFVRERFPGVRVHTSPRNLGFAARYDEVARASTSDYLVFLNNDTRVEPTWVSELVEAAARHRAQCVGSRILDWDGSRIDFVGGLTSFIGHSWQRHYGEPAATPEEEARPLLFACGGSMLISRDAYLDAGGFDRDFFAYFEDVDLGWRLSLLGYRTILAPAAVTYHRLHGTAARFALTQRMRLYERNALATIYKNYEDASLRRILPAAIALSLRRGLAGSGVDASRFAFGAPRSATIDVTAWTVVHLIALEDFGRQLPALAAKRAAIQRRRRRSDLDLAPLFGEPFRLHEDGRYEAIAHALIRDFAIAPLFASAGVPSPDCPAAIEPAVPAPPPASGAPAGAPASGAPLVSIVILTLLGPRHLNDCLLSLRALTYPADRREVIVVDNASAVNPAAAVAEYYPGARVIRNDANLGFAAANNIGARAAAGHYVVFLNDDTRVHPDWLSALVETAVRRGAASVGSRVLSWDGQRLDFVGGAVNCEGKGFQLDYDQPAAGRHLDERPLLFACGAAILVHRETFLDSGGWDEGTFAYYEDVELGWRFWLLGHEVWSSPASVVYHRHHGTSGSWPEPPRMRLYERNSLRILYTHLERETLEGVLPAALLLACDRALLATHLSRATDGGNGAAPGAVSTASARQRVAPLMTRVKGALRDRGVRRRQGIAENARHLGLRGLAGAMLEVARETVRPTPDAVAEYRIERGGSGHAVLVGRVEPFPSSAAAALTGVHEFIDGLPELSERRRRLQSARRRSDAEILSRFGSHWLHPGVAPHQREHEGLHRRLLELFDVAGRARTWTGPT